ncbi:MAG: 4Fe-4S binding protein [Firmicutes bacterium]|nr:4Fe-4S binding protein [Bacillota bacterium]
MDMSVNFMGIKCKNPIFVSASPMTSCYEMIQKAVDAGAGGIITKSITSDVRENVRPRMVVGKTGLQNIELYSDLSIEEWEDEIRKIKENDISIIANISGNTPSEVAYIAKTLEGFGVDGIELGLSIPHGEGMEVLTSNPEEVYRFTKKTVDTVSIPVMVKLSSNVSNIKDIAKAIERAGASAISGIDTVRSIMGVDINRRSVHLPTYGGYSGDGIRPIGLAAIATVSQAVSIPVSGIGGIMNHENVLEYMMLGASTVQLCTTILMNGYGIIGEILSKLEKWMKENNVESFDQIKGSALKSLKSFEEIKNLPYVAKVSDMGDCSGCKKCIHKCIYSAISASGEGIYIDPKKCTGCGICASVCKNISLGWY